MTRRIPYASNTAEHEDLAKIPLAGGTFVVVQEWTWWTLRRCRRPNHAVDHVFQHRAYSLWEIDAEGTQLGDEVQLFPSSVGYDLVAAMLKGASAPWGDSAEQLPLPDLGGRW